MSDNLWILAGQTARRRINDEGLRPQAIRVIAGAAGGPKWLVLGGLDRALFGSWLTDITHPIWLIGSSIGAWRFAALAQDDGLQAYELFEEAYTGQRYARRPSPADVTRESIKILNTYLTAADAEAVLHHPFFRLAVITAHCRRGLASEIIPLQAAGMALTAAGNALDRGSLGRTLTRTLFHDRRERPPLGQDHLPTRYIPLDAANLCPAVLASGSIPLVMSGVRDIPGSPPGIYRDGGLMDYHLDLPYANEDLILYPHYTRRLIPGWFDKHLPMRPPTSAALSRMVMLCPSPDFIARLPGGTVPDRGDFRQFFRHDDDRIAQWRRVIEACRTLGDEFLELAHSPRLSAHIRPIEDAFSS